MILKLVGLKSVILTLAMVSPAVAQQAGKVPRVGYLAIVPLSALAPRTDAFREGLRERGYIEGKNIIVELRSTDGNSDRVAELAGELIRMNVDVIVTAGGGVTRVVKRATSTIPIVMAQDSDPVANGFVASLARPGGNVTGLSNLSSELVGKRLELLKEVVPGLSRLAVFGTSSNADNKRELKEIETTATAFGVKLQRVDLLESKDIGPAFRSAAKARAQAVIWIVSGPVGGAHRKEISEQAIKIRLPVIYHQVSFVEAGGLMAYAASLNDLYRRAATYVDKLLKGAKPAELPVEQPIKFEFIINLKAAKQIVLTIPPNVLVRADRVIR